jgi:hypothetical protein
MRVVEVEAQLLVLQQALEELAVVVLGNHQIAGWLALQELQTQVVVVVVARLVLVLVAQADQALS